MAELNRRIAAGRTLQVGCTTNAFLDRPQSSSHPLCDSAATSAGGRKSHARFRLDRDCSCCNWLYLTVRTPRPSHWQEQSELLEQERPKWTATPARIPRCSSKTASGGGKLWRIIGWNITAVAATNWSRKWKQIGRGRRIRPCLDDFKRCKVGSDWFCRRPATRPVRKGKPDNTFVVPPF